VSNGQDDPRYDQLRIKPGRNPCDRGDDRFASVRSCRWIFNPVGEGFRLLRLHLVEGLARPSPVIAISKHRLDRCFETQGRRGLSGPPGGARDTMIPVLQVMRKSAQLSTPLRVEFLVGRKR
jgi:hypothetical protein